MASDPQDLVGEILGGCRIGSLIGAGGMGAVYEAFHLALEKKVAVKVLLPGATRRPESLKRFLREAKAAARLEHPNIVQVMNVGRRGDEYYIVMQLVDGRSLKDVVEEREALPAPEACSLVHQAARALEAAHANGVIHRDVKPDNMLLAPDGTLKMTDFGLAATTDKASSITSADSILGTPYFMSPEQCRGDAADERSDVYSLGATFYFLLTGTYPFTGESVMATLMKHINEPPVPPRQLAPDVPRDVSDLVLWMMTKDKTGRPGSMGEVQAAIEAIHPQAGTGRVEVRVARKPVPPAAFVVGTLMLALGITALALVLTGAGSGRSEAARALEGAGRFAREHPADFFGQAAAYEEVAKVHPGTPEAADARKAAKSCREAGSKVIREKEKAVLEKARSLINRREFEKASATMREFLAGTGGSYQPSGALSALVEEAGVMASARSKADAKDYIGGEKLLRDAASRVRDSKKAGEMGDLADRFAAVAEVHRLSQSLSDDLGNMSGELMERYFNARREQGEALIIMAAWRTVMLYFELLSKSVHPASPFEIPRDNRIPVVFRARGKRLSDGSEETIEETVQWRNRGEGWFAELKVQDSRLVRLALELRTADLVKGINERNMKLLFFVCHIPRDISREEFTKLVTALMAGSAVVELEEFRIDSISAVPPHPVVKVEGQQTTQTRHGGRRNTKPWTAHFAVTDDVLKLMVTPDPRFK